MQSSIEWLLVWYACQKLGVAVVPLYARLNPQEHARAIKLAFGLVGVDERGMRKSAGE